MADRPAAAAGGRGRTARRCPSRSREHAEFACERLQRMALEISSTMSKFQLKLADRQCRMAELSQRCQDFDHDPGHQPVRRAARGRNRSATRPTCCARTCAHKLLGRRPSNHYFRQATGLGAGIADGEFRSIAGLEPDEILMRYEQ